MNNSKHKKKKLSIFKKFNTIGAEEIEATVSLMKTGILSNFVGAKSQYFNGGKKVNEFEKKIQKYFKVKNAITVNSCTSGLIAAVGALGIEPGDEVIVSPLTMTASATSILVWNAIPVFADIELDTFNLDPLSVKKNITKKTKAILSVDLFGQSGNVKALKLIAKKYNLKIISDSAQSIGSFYHGKYTGTLTDVGVYSLNCNKHIQTGEGGILVTNNNKIAKKLRLIRNHAEAVVTSKSSLNNMIGFNFRLGEIESAIGIEQLKKLKKIIINKQNNAKQLTNGLKDLKGLILPKINKNCTHSFYVYGMRIDNNLVNVDSKKIVERLKLKGIQMAYKYGNIHYLPIYQNKIAYGSKNYPWSYNYNNLSKVNYRKGICPNSEKLNEGLFIGLGLCRYDYSKSDINYIISSFKEVWFGLLKK